jgi:hypothetical protein
MPQGTPGCGLVGEMGGRRQQIELNWMQRACLPARRYFEVDEAEQKLRSMLAWRKQFRWVCV